MARPPVTSAVPSIVSPRTRPRNRIERELGFMAMVVEKAMTHREHGLHDGGRARSRAHDSAETLVILLEHGCGRGLAVREGDPEGPPSLHPRGDNPEVDPLGTAAHEDAHGAIRNPLPHVKVVRDDGCPGPQLGQELRTKPQIDLG